MGKKSRGSRTRGGHGHVAVVRNILMRSSTTTREKITPSSGTHSISARFTSALQNRFYRDGSTFAIRRLAMRKREERQKIQRKALREETRHRSALRAVRELRRRAALRTLRETRRHTMRCVRVGTERRSAETIQAYVRLWLRTRNFYCKRESARQAREVEAATTIQRAFRISRLFAKHRAYEQRVCEMNRASRALTGVLRICVAKKRANRERARRKRARAASVVQRSWRERWIRARALKRAIERNIARDRQNIAIAIAAKVSKMKRVERKAANFQKRVDCALERRKCMGDRRREDLMRGSYAKFVRIAEELAADDTTFNHKQTAAATPPVLFPLISKDPTLRGGRGEKQRLRARKSTSTIRANALRQSKNQEEGEKDNDEKKKMGLSSERRSWNVHFMKLGILEPDNRLHKEKWRRQKKKDAENRRNRWSKAIETPES